MVENKELTPEEKMKLITRVQNGESISTEAYENKMRTGQLSNWIKKYKELGYNGLSKPKGRPKIMKPETKKTIISYFNNHAHVLQTEYEENGTVLQVECKKSDFEKYREYVMN